MNIKRFRFIASLASKGLLIVAGIWTAIILLIIFGLLFGFSSVSFDESNTNYLYFFESHSANITLEQEKLSGLTSVLPAMASYIFFMFLASQLFEDLANGETPFTLIQVKRLKTISIGIILVNLIQPLIRSLVLTLLMNRGHYFSWGLNSEIFIGVAIWVLAEIFAYGIELQTLSDETL